MCGFSVFTNLLLKLLIWNLVKNGWMDGWGSIDFGNYGEIVQPKYSILRIMFVCACNVQKERYDLNQKWNGMECTYPQCTHTYHIPLAKEYGSGQKANINVCNVYKICILVVMNLNININANAMNGYDAINRSNDIFDQFQCAYAKIIAHSHFMSKLLENKFCLRNANHFQIECSFFVCFFAVATRYSWWKFLI